jgi:cell wall-associated NlpC family hydrolase
MAAANVTGLLEMANNSIAGNFGANLAITQKLGDMQRQFNEASQAFTQSEAQANMAGGTTMAGKGTSFQGMPGQLGKIMQAATAQLGKPYVWGAETPNEGFDCSGLIDWAFKQAGIDLPGRLTTQTAVKMGISVKGKPMQPGDWIISNGGKHMVMYVGNNQVISAPRSGEVVQLQPVSRYTNDTVDVRRVVGGRASGGRK